MILQLNLHILEADMTVKEVMTKNPVCITETTSVTEAKQIMNLKKINKLPVLNGSKKLVGIITKNDISKVSPSEATTLDVYEISSLLARLTCGKFMTKNVVTVEENEVVEAAAKLMAEKGIGCLPVMKDGIVTGIITESDLFNLFVSMFDSGESGVRVDFGMDDKPGEINKIISGIAAVNGNLVSVVTHESPRANRRRTTIKVSGAALEKIREIVEKSGAEIFDIRQV